MRRSIFRSPPREFVPDAVPTLTSGGPRGVGGTGPGRNRSRGAPPARAKGGRALLRPAARSASEPPGPREARPEAPGEGRAEAPAVQKNGEAAPARPHLGPGPAPPLTS